MEKISPSSVCGVLAYAVVVVVVVLVVHMLAVSVSLGGGAVLVLSDFGEGVRLVMLLLLAADACGGGCVVLVLLMLMLLLLLLLLLLILSPHSESVPGVLAYGVVVVAVFVVVRILAVSVPLGGGSVMGRGIHVLVFLLFEGSLFFRFLPLRGTEILQQSSCDGGLFVFGCA